MFEDFFRLHAQGADGGTVIMSEVEVEYEVAEGKLRIVGLSDLGQVQKPEDGIYYDDCYQEDRDNYIDIILAGDEAAARNVRFVEIPALAGGYRAFYNPGGPGPEPTEGVPYTAPGPRDLEPVVVAVDDPMRVSRDTASDGLPWLIIGGTVLVIAGIFGLVVWQRRRHSTDHAPRDAEEKSTESTELGRQITGPSG